MRECDKEKGRTAFDTHKHLTLDLLEMSKINHKMNKLSLRRGWEGIFPHHTRPTVYSESDYQHFSNTWELSYCPWLTPKYFTPVFFRMFTVKLAPFAPKSLKWLLPSVTASNPANLIRIARDQFILLTQKPEKELEPKCVPQLFVGLLLGTRQSAIGQLFSCPQNEERSHGRREDNKRVLSLQYILTC